MTTDIMGAQSDWLVRFGPAFFGAVVGWLAHATYASTSGLDVKWLSSVIGVIGGAAVVALFRETQFFAAYCLGLAVAFFVRVVAFSPLAEWLLRRVTG